MNDTNLDYEFESIGPKGIIKKVARFNLIKPNLYNFGLGDLNEITGDISDTIISNNGDKVTSTKRSKTSTENSVGNYEKHPFFIKKANAAREFLEKAGLPKQLAAKS